MNKQPEKHRACTLNELKQATCLEWEKMVHDELQQCFLVYSAQNIVSYKNHCPHTGINLNWQPNQFLDAGGKLIQCSLHGALFEIETGRCLHGPCLGDRLTPVKNEVIDDEIYLFL